MGCNSRLAALRCSQVSHFRLIMLSPRRVAYKKKEKPAGDYPAGFIVFLSSCVAWEVEDLSRRRGLCLSYDFISAPTYAISSFQNFAMLSQ